MRRLLLNFMMVASAALPLSATANAAKVYTGTVRAACPQPDGKESFEIILSNNLQALVYGSLAAIEKSGGSISYPVVNTDMKDGEARLTKCDRQGTNCRHKPGLVSIAMFEGDYITGVIRIALAGWGRSYNGSEDDMFKAEYDRAYKPSCNKPVPSHKK